MADSEHVSSTTHFEEEELDSLRNNGVMGDLNEALAEDVVNDDEIVDLVGGARDAIERHKSTWSQPEDLPKEVSEKFSAQEPEPVLFSEPETELKPLLAPPTKVKEDATEQPTEEVIPDSTTDVEEPEEKVIALEAEPEHTLIVPEPVEEIPEVPQAEPVSVIPEPIPEPVAIAPPPAPVEEVLPKAAPVKEAPVPAAPAPASYELLPPTAAPHPLMQFPTALGQKGDSPAPISPLSPLNSPDSLEELSLSESPNQPPASAATFWPSSKPPEALTKDMPWDGEEGNFRPGHGNRDVEETVDGLTSPYLCLGKESRPLCEDSGVSTSPEEKLFSSDRSAGLSQSPTKFQTKVLESHTAPASNPTDHWDTPFLASQDNSRVSMDTFSKNTAPIGSSEYQPDMLGNQSDDNLMFEIKKNPFQGFSPVADAAYSHFGESKADSSANKMSESPTPDLVQYGQTGDSQESPPSFYDEDKTYESVKMAADSLMQPLHQISSNTKEGDTVLPPSLPDILKSSPLNPEKLDSGSSEGSPEEQSPILVRKMMESPNPPINLSVNNPFALDSKISLLKEMAEETEQKLKSGDKIKVKDDDEKCFGAFDLVKEAEESTPPQLKEDKPFQIEHKDWFSSYDSPKSSTKFEPLDLQHKKTSAEESDSESPSADSLSPVLEAMAKNPSIFQVETEQKKAKMDIEEAEAAEEASEPEVSSEEFEFIERPPRGVIDEFLEALDNSKFASNAPELSRDNKMSFGINDKLVATKAAQPEEEEEEEEETPNQSSYLLLSQPSEKASPQKSKANLEKLDVREPPSQAPLTHSPVRKSAEAVAKKETWGSSWMPNLNIKSVVDLLYWRDVKTTGVVFGAVLLLLLSLSVCSIVSVCSYVGLALLSVTIAFRIYKGILQAIQKSDEGHPFKLYLDQEVALSEDVVHKYSDAALAQINQIIATLRRVFLVEDLVDSLKFAVLMWVLTYVGALFNGLTILILGLVGAFSCPIIYEKHQVQIDHYVGKVNSQIKDAVGKIQAKVPGLKRKAE